MRIYILLGLGILWTFALVGQSITTDTIEIDEVIKLIKDKPKNVELILTGRYADTKLIDLADLVTEMKNIKHPYDKGAKSRKGIEY